MDGEAHIYTPDEMMMLGMKCLVDNFGLVNAEQFINSVRAACPDYTIWRRRMFDGMSVDDVFRMVDEDTDNPLERWLLVIAGTRHAAWDQGCRSLPPRLRHLFGMRLFHHSRRPHPQVQGREGQYYISGRLHIAGGGVTWNTKSTP